MQEPHVRDSLGSLLRSWDGEEVIIRHDAPTGAWIAIAIYSTRLGPATGGTRMRPYPDLTAAVRDALHLAESMAYKFAIADFPRGGGKAVIAVPPDLRPEERPALLRRYGSLIKGLGGLYETGPDIGTSPEDMDLIAETGAPHVFCRTPAAGGAGDSGPATARGVFEGIRVVCRHLWDGDVSGRRVLVQGAGSVGGRLIELLRAARAEVLVSDVDERALRRFRGEPGVTLLPPHAVLDTPCDVFAPCALGGVLSEETIPRLRCRAVAGAANNQLAAEDDAARLQERAILYAPDFVLNLGGAVAITGVEALGWPAAEAEERVAGIVADALQHILATAAAEGITTVAAGRRLAESRLYGELHSSSQL